MSILGAMLTATAGLTAQSYSMENISGNIANSQTAGFKRVETSFVDLIPDLPKGQEISGSVGGYSSLTTTIQGDIQATGVGTNMAISGDGFFAVQGKTGDGTNYYTRRGDFTLDKDGHLVNGAGYALQGTSLAMTGQATNAGDSRLTVSNAPVPAKPTTTITYGANLPSTPATDASSNGGSELLDPTLVKNGAILYEDRTAFMQQTVSGGSVTAYTADGTPVEAQLRWGKVASTSSTPPNATNDWDLFYCTNPSASATGQPMWTQVARTAGQPTVQFDGNGALAASSPSSISTPLTIGVASVGNVAFDFGSGLTQYASATGAVGLNTLKQDGYSQGSLGAVAIRSNGDVVGTYSNGQITTIGKVSVVKFQNGNALKRLDGGAYAQTLDAGEPIDAFKNGSSVVGGNVEGSNVDIAEEFSKLIVTQQAYSANTRVLSTAQQMLQDVMSVVR